MKMNKVIFNKVTYGLNRKSTATCLTKMIALTILSLAMFHNPQRVSGMSQTNSSAHGMIGFDPKEGYNLFQNHLTSKNGSSSSTLKPRSLHKGTKLTSVVDSKKRYCSRYHLTPYKRTKIDRSITSMARAIAKVGRHVQFGGKWGPRKCKAWRRTAIIIPYRDRPQHLPILLSFLHPYLQRQNRSYWIFVVEQAGKEPFNKGTLLNIGFVEANKLASFDCFIFHDVDLLPGTNRIPYSCFDRPTKLSSTVILSNGTKMRGAGDFGGVISLSGAHYKKINGFSNLFYGWGGEDNSFFQRIISKGFSAQFWSYDEFIMLYHSQRQPNDDRYGTMGKSFKVLNFDGLNSLTYQKLGMRFRPLHTWILARIPSSKPFTKHDSP